LSDIFSVLQSAYASQSLNPAATAGKYVPVQASDYQGTWRGTYQTASGGGTPFSFTISNVSGFKAQVKYQSGATVQYQSVLIKNGSFRVGDTQFTLAGSGTAQIKNVLTSPIDGSLSVETAEATQSAV